VSTSLWQDATGLDLDVHLSRVRLGNLALNDLESPPGLGTCATFIGADGVYSCHHGSFNSGNRVEKHLLAV
jgi:hypothetical protein